MKTKELIELLEKMGAKRVRVAYPNFYYELAGHTISFNSVREELTEDDRARIMSILVVMKQEAMKKDAKEKK